MPKHRHVKHLTREINGRDIAQLALFIWLDWRVHKYWGESSIYSYHEWARSASSAVSSLQRTVEFVGKLIHTAQMHDDENAGQTYPCGSSLISKAYDGNPSPRGLLRLIPVVPQQHLHFLTSLPASPPVRLQTPWASSAWALIHHEWGEERRDGGGRDSRMGVVQHRAQTNKRHI